MTQSSQLLEKLGHIVDALDYFSEWKNSLFNVSKLATMLQLSKDEVDKIITIIFKLQTQFSTVFNNFKLKKIWKNGTIYLNLVPKDLTNNNHLLKEIIFTKVHSNLLNDIIYYFEHVKIGKGFNVHINDTELSKNVSELHKAHPYLFESKGNGLIYPTKLAVEIGKQLHSYNKSNREVSTLDINEYKIIIK